MNSNEIFKNDIITKTLEKKFFELALKEKFPDTPELTAELDALQKEIKIRKGLSKE